MFQFYAAGIPKATPAEEVAAVIHEAATTDEYRLRWPVSWGGPELVAGRAAMSDEEWVAMGAVDDDEYYTRFSRLLGDGHLTGLSAPAGSTCEPPAVARAMGDAYVMECPEKARRSDRRRRLLPTGALRRRRPRR